MEETTFRFNIYFELIISYFISHLCSAVAFCAKVVVPLNRDNATDTRTIEYFVKKIYRSSITTQDTQMWMFAGGPGDTGVEMEGFLPAIFGSGLLDNAVVYIPDHRGTGRSNYVDCPTVKSFNPTCWSNLIAQWGIDGITSKKFFLSYEIFFCETDQKLLKLPKAISTTFDPFHKRKSFFHLFLRF